MISRTFRRLSILVCFEAGDFVAHHRKAAHVAEGHVVQCENVSNKAERNQLAHSRAAPKQSEQDAAEMKEEEGDDDEV